MSFVDKSYQMALRFKIFSRGLGNPETIMKIIDSHNMISNKDRCRKLTGDIHVNVIKKEDKGDYTLTEGHFISPFHINFPNYFDDNNKMARFQLLMPKTHKSRYRPLCIHFSRTGLEKFDNEYQELPKKLLNYGIASLLHMHPYYGARKPKDQKGCELNYVTDLLLMGSADILESHALINWAKQQSFHPIGLHGISLGGHMASLSGTTYHEPICIIPVLSWTTASAVFLRGVYNSAVDWNLLAQQYHNDESFYKIIKSQLQPPICRPDLMKYRIVNNCKELQSSSDKDIIPLVIQQSCINDSLNSQKLYPNSVQSDLLLENKSMSYDASPLQTTTVKSSQNWKNIKPILSKTSEILTSMSFRDKSQIKNSTDSNKIQILDDHREVYSFMEDLLDYCTHLGNFPKPEDTKLVTFVIAERDGFFPMEGLPHIHEIWDDQCLVKKIKSSGHIGGYLFKKDHFLNAIVESYNRYVELYENEQGPFISPKKRH